MRPRNKEFSALLAISGWKSAEAARRLELHPASISRYLSDEDQATPQTLRLFKIVLAYEKSEALGAALRDAPDGLDSEAWRRRAILAEEELERLRSEIRELLAGQKVSYAPLSKPEETALAAAGSAQRLAQESGRKQKAGGPTGDKPAPDGGAESENK